MDQESSPAINREDTALPLCRCRFLRPVAVDWLWPVEGICWGRVDGCLMVPPVSHYLNLCVTDNHHLCEVFRARAIVLHAVADDPMDPAARGSPRPELSLPISTPPRHS